nr:hypothetical protein [Kibdelosporangium sp. MJ126-NF4]
MAGIGTVGSWLVWSAVDVPVGRVAVRDVVDLSLWRQESTIG